MACLNKEAIDKSPQHAQMPCKARLHPESRRQSDQSDATAREEASSQGPHQDRCEHMAAPAVSLGPYQNTVAFISIKLNRMSPKD